MYYERQRIDFILLRCSLFGADPTELIKLYTLVSDPISQLDRRQLYNIGIPARDMEHRSDLKKYILEIGAEYVKIQRNSSFRQIGKARDRLFYHLSKSMSVGKFLNVVNGALSESFRIGELEAKLVKGGASRELILAIKEEAKSRSSVSTSSYSDVCTFLFSKVGNKLFRGESISINDIKNL